MRAWQIRSVASARHESTRRCGLIGGVKLQPVALCLTRPGSARSRIMWFGRVVSLLRHHRAEGLARPSSNHGGVVPLTRSFNARSSKRTRRPQNSPNGPWWLAVSVMHAVAVLCTATPSDDGKLVVLARHWLARRAHLHAVQALRHLRPVTYVCFKLQKRTFALKPTVFIQPQQIAET